MLLWRDAMVLFHHAPILGIGAGELTQTYHQVSHNSFVQTYAEMGLVGGTIFVGVMVMPIFVCRAIAKSLPKSSADELRRWNFTILSITVGYIIGMCSLSRSSTVPTFIPPALAGALSAIVTRAYPWFRTPLNFAIVRRICIASAVAVAALEICRGTSSVDSSAESEAMLDVFLTVDTEFYPLRPDWRIAGLSRDIARDLYGKTERGEFGVSYQLNVLAANGLKATFFVEGLCGSAAGDEVLGRLVDEIQSKGQEVQLHLHPEWLQWMANPPVPSQGAN